MPNLDTIGKRAAWAIDGRCAQNRTKKYTECKNLGIDPTHLSNWRNGKNDPGAYYLRNMALNGYDVLWILTGRKSDGT